MSKISVELSSATAVHQGEDKPEVFREKLVRAAAKLDDTKWGNLSEAAQKWVNDNVDRVKAKETPSAFPDVEGAEAPKKRTAKVAEVKNEVAPKVKKEAAPKVKKEEAAPKVKKEGTSLFRKLVIANHFKDEVGKLKRTELIEGAIKSGLTITSSTADVAYYETTATIRVLEELKLLKKPKVEVTE